MDDLLHSDDLLIRHLDGELSGAEKSALQERLDTDSALRERLIKLQVAVEAVRQLGTTQQVFAVHAEMMKEFKPQQTSRLIPFRKTIIYIMSVAASTFVLFVGVRLYLAAQLSPEKIYSQTFVDFNVSASRSAGAIISKIESHYQQKDYETVISNVRSIRMEAKDSLLVGLAYLQMANTTQAIGIFQRLASSQNEYRQDAEFYLSLAYLKKGDAARSFALMQKIHNNSAHLYHEQISDEVLEKVKKLNAK